MKRKKKDVDRHIRYIDSDDDIDFLKIDAKKYILPAKKKLDGLNDNISESELSESDSDPDFLKYCAKKYKKPTKQKLDGINQNISESDLSDSDFSYNNYVNNNNDFKLFAYDIKGLYDDPAINPDHIDSHDFCIKYVFPLWDEFYENIKNSKLSFEKFKQYTKAKQIIILHMIITAIQYSYYDIPLFPKLFNYYVNRKDFTSINIHFIGQLIYIITVHGSITYNKISESFKKIFKMCIIPLEILYSYDLYEYINYKAKCLLWAIDYINEQYKINNNDCKKLMHDLRNSDIDLLLLCDDIKESFEFVESYLSSRRFLDNFQTDKDYKNFLKLIEEYTNKSKKMSKIIWNNITSIWDSIRFYHSYLDVNNKNNPKRILAIDKINNKNDYIKYYLKFCMDFKLELDNEQLLYIIRNRQLCYENYYQNIETILKMTCKKINKQMVLTLLDNPDIIVYSEDGKSNICDNIDLCDYEQNLCNNFISYKALKELIKNINKKYVDIGNFVLTVDDIVKYQHLSQSLITEKMPKYISENDFKKLCVSINNFESCYFSKLLITDRLIPVNEETFITAYLSGNSDFLNYMFGNKFIITKDIFLKLPLRYGSFMIFDDFKMDSECFMYYNSMISNYLKLNGIFRYDDDYKLKVPRQKYFGSTKKDIFTFCLENGFLTCDISDVDNLKKYINELPKNIVPKKYHKYYDNNDIDKKIEVSIENTTTRKLDKAYIHKLMISSKRVNDKNMDYLLFAVNYKPSKEEIDLLPDGYYKQYLVYHATKSQKE